MLPSAVLSSETGLSFSLDYSSPSLPLLKVSTSMIQVNPLITTHLPTPEVWKTWLTFYPHSGNLSTIDQSQGKKSPPARDCYILTTERQFNSCYVVIMTLLLLVVHAIDGISCQSAMQTLVSISFRSYH